MRQSGAGRRSLGTGVAAPVTGTTVIEPDLHQAAFAFAKAATSAWVANQTPFDLA